MNLSTPTSHFVLFATEEMGFHHMLPGFLYLAFLCFCRGTSLWYDPLYPHHRPPPLSTPFSLHFAVASAGSAGSDLSMHQLAGSAGLQGPVWKRAEIHNDQSLRLTE